MKRTVSKEESIVRPARTAAQARGDAAEALAAEFLARRGLAQVTRNVRCRGGEIDLVCMERDVLVFVEVRLRSNVRFGGAAESITARKRQRIILAARWWLNGAGRRHANRPCRFDAVLMDGPDEHNITWIQGAFDAS